MEKEGKSWFVKDSKLFKFFIKYVNGCFVWKNLREGNRFLKLISFGKASLSKLLEKVEYYCKEEFKRGFARFRKNGGNPIDWKDVLMRHGSLFNAQLAQLRQKVSL